MSGGDKVPAELEREFTALAGLPVDEACGMSEIGVATINPPSGLNKISSIGRLNPGYQASIRDESGTELSTGAEGRLWIKSPCNTVGYWNRPDATAETIKDGWLDTGDVMRADDDGYLWFCGRKKQIIVHDGSNICPQEVEEALLEHEAVTGAGVIGVHDLVHGEDVRAYITLRRDAAQPTGQELIRFARARVGYKAPEEIVSLSSGWRRNARAAEAAPSPSLRVPLRLRAGGTPHAACLDCPRTLGDGAPSARASRRWTSTCRSPRCR
jgi:long-chain acyl-CoA synthetase